MVTPNNNDSEAFVWIWLPNETQPVVAGRLKADARAIVEHQRCIIEKNWGLICEEAQLSKRRYYIKPFLFSHFQAAPHYSLLFADPTSDAI